MATTIGRLTSCGVTLLLAACGSFTAGVEEPDLMAKSARIESEIHPGQTTRQEVRARLGAPIFESRDWGVDLYRSDETDLSTEWLVVLMVPVPGWTEVRDYRLHPLIVYSSSNVVEGIGVGRYEEHHGGGMVSGAPKSPSGTNADVLGFTLAVDSCDDPACLWLLAPADRSVEALRALPAPGRCVLSVARSGNGVEVALDDETVLRSIGSGSGWGDSVPAEHWLARVIVSPGIHTIRVILTGPSLAVGGELDQIIDCRGDQWFVISVAQEFEKATSFFTRAQLILFHNDRAPTAAH